MDVMTAKWPLGITWRLNQHKINCRVYNIIIASIGTKHEQRKVYSRLSKLQRLAYIWVTGAIRSTAMEILLNLPSIRGCRSLHRHISHQLGNWNEKWLNPFLKQMLTRTESKLTSESKLVYTAKSSYEDVCLDRKLCKITELFKLLTTKVAPSVYEFIDPLKYSRYILPKDRILKTSITPGKTTDAVHNGRLDWRGLPIEKMRSRYWYTLELMYGGSVTCWNHISHLDI